MPPSIEIRDGNYSDLPAILGIFDSWYPHNWDKNIAEQYFKKFFNKNDHCSADKVFILSVAEEIVGVAGYCPDRMGANDICWLGWFYIHKGKIGHSYGRNLLLYVIKQIKAKSFRKIYIDTTNNTFYAPARKLYERLGFKLEATLFDYYESEENKLIYGFNLTDNNCRRC